MVRTAFSEQMDRLRTGIFLLAVVLVNFTISRPSPVDIAFALALLMTPLCGQRLTRRGLVFLALILAWWAGLMTSSMPFTYDGEVVYQLTKTSYAMSIGITACLVNMHWGRQQIERLYKFWIGSACLAATFATIGFVLKIDELIWDGRGKGFFDDPNMYAAFLPPAVLGCIYFILTTKTRRRYIAALALLTIGLMVAFSRVAVAATLLTGLVLTLFLNRKRLAKTIMNLAAVAAVAVIAGAIAVAVIPEFAEKLSDRATLAKDYDVGEMGRLNRYLKAFNLTINDPIGMGVLQFEAIFPEPIHNFWLSSFVNYGWLAGFAWTAVVYFGVILTIRNYRQTGDSLMVLIYLSWLGIFACALLHEAERWRHLWFFTGFLWGVNPHNWRQTVRAPAPASPPRDIRAAPAMARHLPPHPGLLRQKPSVS
ncbi:MAG TPA: O-antigen ligase family protein [Beijerinckiaceae bacterium]|nr:O-antigen ligase family protein [Beijerinckiaceae bacterium]